MKMRYYKKQRRVNARRIHVLENCAEQALTARTKRRLDINKRRIRKREGDKAKVNENIFVYQKN